MGWAVKILAFVFALFAFSLGAWIVGVPILLLLFLPLVRRGSGPAGREHRQHPQTKRSAAPVRYLVAGFFFLLSVAAGASGGTASPFAFAVLGVVALVYGRFGGLPFASPVLVDDSAVLRDRLFPFRWYAAAAVKFATKDPAAILSLLDGRVVFRMGETGRVYLVVEMTAPTLRRAERLAGDRLRLLAESLLPFGGYLLPLDGKDALDVLFCAGERVKLADGDLGRSLAASPFDTLVMRSVGPTVEALDAYRSAGSRGRSVLKGENAAGRISTWEVAAAIGKRCSWSQPDDLLAFLSSLAAARSAGMGQKLVNVGDAGAQSLQVRSLNTPPVELSRAQLRLLIAVYS